MGQLFIQSTGSITNSGCTDTDAPLLTGSAATVAGAVVTLDGSPDLSGLVTSGATQSTIFLADASNSNQKIFWITAVDNVLKTVTVTPSPTGVVSSAWTIGGRFYLGATGSPQNASIEAALRAGDTVIINDSPNPQAAVMWTFRNAGTTAGGFATLKGKTGVRPLLKTTANNTNVVVGLANCWVENLELQTTSGNGAGVSFGGAVSGCTVFNCKIKTTAPNGVGVGAASVTSLRVVGCEIFDGGNGITSNGANIALIGNCIHDVGGNAMQLGGNPQHAVINNIILRAGGRGILMSGGPSNQANGMLVANNTVVGCGNSGFEVSDADSAVTLFNNIFMDNGDASGEANIEWVAGTAEYASIHGYNTIYSNLGVAPINFTLNAQIAASEFSTNPLLVEPFGGNMELQPASPALNTGFPAVFNGGLTTGSPSQGAVTPEPSSAGTVTFDTALTIRL